MLGVDTNNVNGDLGLQCTPVTAAGLSSGSELCVGAAMSCSKGVVVRLVSDPCNRYTLTLILPGRCRHWLRRRHLLSSPRAMHLMRKVVASQGLSCALCELRLCRPDPRIRSYVLAMYYDSI